MSITDNGNTNGVDRYISSLIYGLSTNEKYNVIYISFLLDSNKIFIDKRKYGNCTYIEVPTPGKHHLFQDKSYWLDKYNEQLFKLIENEFDNTRFSILHIHYLNLITLALEIKKHIPVKIITHLHCIPWKNVYSINKEKYNFIHWRYIKKDYAANNYITNINELESYQKCDKIICCAECGKDFLLNIAKVPEQHIVTICNGIEDTYNVKKRNKNKITRLLFVGSVIPAKGVDFILEAIEKVVKKGYKNIELYIAGGYESRYKNSLLEKYHNVKQHYLGRLTYVDLSYYYQTSDIGVIGSLFEQNSYVAIEMCMNQLAMVITDSPGLDEMFTHDVNALKIPTTFDRISGLQIDTDAMCEAIISLIESDEKRMKISKSARELYLRKYNLNEMINNIQNVYSSII